MVHKAHQNELHSDQNKQNLTLLKETYHMIQCTSPGCLPKDSKQHHRDPHTVSHVALWTNPSLWGHPRHKEMGKACAVCAWWNHAAVKKTDISFVRRKWLDSVMLHQKYNVCLLKKKNLSFTKDHPDSNPGNSLSFTSSETDHCLYSCDTIERTQQHLWYIPKMPYFNLLYLSFKI